MEMLDINGGDPQNLINKLNSCFNALLNITIRVNLKQLS